MPDTPDRAIAPRALNHVVLNVRDIEESHRFYTDLIGLKLVGALRATEKRPDPPKMRFYSADHDGKPSHHDLALVENRSLPVADPKACAVHHVALTLPSREAFVRQLAFLQARGVAFESRVEHGPTHSLYIRDPNGYGVELNYELPREVWENDIDASVNYYVAVPTDGAAALQDNAETPKFGAVPVA